MLQGPFGKHWGAVPQERTVREASVSRGAAVAAAVLLLVLCCCWCCAVKTCFEVTIVAPQAGPNGARSC